MKRFIFIVLAFAFVLYGCENKQIEEQEVHYCETVNPYDFVGEMHNAGLNAVRDSLTSTKATISEEQIESFVASFCEKVFVEDERFSIQNITKADEYDNSTYEEEVVLSEKAEIYCKQILEITESDDYTRVKEQLLEIEDIIVNQSESFTEYEKALLLCSIAVGKYSSEYWEEYQAGTKSAAGAIVGADVAGALKGIKAHAVEIVICGAIGGVGCGLAAAGRAALGPAVASSAVMGVVQAFNAWF